MDIPYSKRIADMQPEELRRSVCRLSRLLTRYGRSKLLPYWRNEFRRRKGKTTATPCPATPIGV